MPKLMENVHTLNSFLRTLLALVVVGGAGTAGYYGYMRFTAAEREAAQKEAELAEKEKVIQEQASAIVKKNAEIERLATSLRLHKMDRRLARITVLDTGTDPDTNKKFSQIEFVELNSQDDEVGEPRQFRVDGDLVYVDYWVVKFEDKYVEAADLDRGTTICLFNRLFGEFQKPTDGFVLDQPGQAPGSYARGSKMSDFEKKIWDDFWNIANSPDKATELGIRTAHGEAISIKVVKGKTYRVSVRSSGGPEIETKDHGQPAGKPKAAPPTSTGESQPSRRPWPAWTPVRKRLVADAPQALGTSHLADAQ